MDSNHHTKKYIDFHNKYTKIYGENTVVLMQSGSHFNIFAVINDLFITIHFVIINRNQLHFTVLLSKFFMPFNF